MTNSISLARRIKEKKCVRVAAYPFEQIRRRLRVLKYHGSKDSQYMKTLKGIHKGDRCFVIGNGPSLSPKDLDKLQAAGISCFAANRIYQIFPQTKWRPTYYLSMDIYVLHESFNEIRRGNYPKFINFTARGLGRRPNENIHYICEFENFKLDTYKLMPKSLSEDLSWFGTKNATVTVNAIELAIYMGYRTIYLLGVDNSYRHQRKADGTVCIDSTIYADYFKGGGPNESQAISVLPIDYTIASYELAKKFAEEHGVKIYNATRGGKLEVFERLDFDKILK